MSVEIGRPVAATLVLCALLSVGALGIGALAVDLSAAEEERQAKADFVSHGLETGRRLAGLPGAAAPAPSLLVEAESETLAAAAVDALVRSTAAEAGGSVLSSRADAKHDEAGAMPGRIEVQAVLEGPNDVLQDILLRLESGAPVMLVGDLSIEPAPASAGETGGDKAQRLHADVTLSAYWSGAKK